MHCAQPLGPRHWFLTFFLLLVICVAFVVTNYDSEELSKDVCNIFLMCCYHYVVIIECSGGSRIHNY